MSIKNYDKPLKNRSRVFYIVDGVYNEVLN